MGNRTGFVDYKPEDQFHIGENDELIANLKESLRTGKHYNDVAGYDDSMYDDPTADID